MREYEVAFIIRPTVDEGNISGIIDQVKEYITRFNGKVNNSDVWGRRRLAYPINDYREGVYVLCKSEIQPTSVPQIEQNLKLLDDIIRHMVIRVEK